MVSTLAESPEATYTIASVSKADGRNVPIRITNSCTVAIELYLGETVAKFCPLLEPTYSATYPPNNPSCNVSLQRSSHG